MRTHVAKSKIGTRWAKAFRSEAEFIDGLKGQNRPIADISFARKNAQQSYMNGIRAGNLIITEACSDPMTSRTLADPHLCFVIPTSGRGTIVDGSKSFDWTNSNQVMRLPFANPIENRNLGFSWVTLHPDFSDFKEALETVASGTTDLPERLMSSPSSMYSRQLNGVEYYDALMTLVSIVQKSNDDEEFLSRIGIDSVFIRLLAEMTAAQDQSSADTTASSKPTRSARAVDVICDYIKENIGTPMTIPSMEKLSGLTGRAIGYAFQSRFGCSPQEWQRSFLLDEAQRILSSPENISSVKTVSYDLGFSSASSFASHYKRRFGERPSETIVRQHPSGSTPLKS